VAYDGKKLSAKLRLSSEEKHEETSFQGQLECGNTTLYESLQLALSKKKKPVAKGGQKAKK